jgi:4a-hydroxytetrahydrobiopterin dehydratase
MSSNAADLRRKHCLPCEERLPSLTRDRIEVLLNVLPTWKLTEDGKRIRREWRVKNFVTVLDFFNRVGQVAEEEGHHPDLHLVAYRNVAIELWTHAIDGLSENDFIMAAKIEALPLELKS